MSYMPYMVQKTFMFFYALYGSKKTNMFPVFQK